MTEYKNIKVKKVDYGFGYVMKGDMSTLTVDNVLTNLDYQFKELKAQIEELEKATQGYRYRGVEERLYNENKKLKAQIELLEKAVDFYADESNWDGYGNNQFIDIDSEDYTQEFINQSGELEQELIGNFGGKLARKTKQELEKMRNKNEY